MVARTLRFVATGLGNVGRRFLEIVGTQEEWLARRHGLRLRAVGVADSSGAAIDPGGLDIAAIAAWKQRGGGVAQLPGVGRPGVGGVTLVETVAADLLLEATPSDPRDGEPGLAIVRAAQARGLHVVMASKGPLVRAYAELAAGSDLAARPRAGAPGLRFSGAVGGALPSINIGRRDLAGGRIVRVEGVLNATTQHVLGLRARGLSADAALAEARRVGVAEPDAGLDIGGWDAASKLVIVANAVLGRPTTLADVAVRGIAGVTDAELRAAAEAGRRMTLLAVAESRGDPQAAPDWGLSVGPVALTGEHPLARLEIGELGIVYESQLFGRVLATTRADGPGGTAAAMLRDVLDLAAMLTAARVGG